MSGPDLEYAVRTDDVADAWDSVDAFLAEEHAELIDGAFTRVVISWSRLTPVDRRALLEASTMELRAPVVPLLALGKLRRLRRLVERLDPEPPVPR